VRQEQQHEEVTTKHIICVVSYPRSDFDPHLIEYTFLGLWVRFSIVVNRTMLLSRFKRFAVQV
jgi:hypothetical protein